MKKIIVAIKVIAILVFGVLLLRAYAWCFLSGRGDAQAYICAGNVRMLDHAKRAWAQKHNATNGQVISETPEAIWAELDPYVDGTNRLACPRQPSESHYLYNRIGIPPACRFRAPSEMMQFLFYGRDTDHIYDPSTEGPIVK